MRQPLGRSTLTRPAPRAVPPPPPRSLGRPVRPRPPLPPPTSTPTPAPGALTLDPVVAGAADEVAAATGGQRFDWGRQWYPVAALDSLPRDRPTPFTLLGREIIVWYDGSTWAAFADRCPHRAVPLSEGRLDAAPAARGDGGVMELACAYHGFRFAADGACVAIPQAATPALEARACASSRACAQVFPCAARDDGLLWVWGTPGDAATADATPTGGHALLDRPDELVFITPWYVRDIPVDIDVFQENVVDPSHVPFSHSGILGSRYAPPWQAMAAAPRPRAGGNPHPAHDAVEEAEDAGGFAVRVAYLGKTRPADATAQPPIPDDPNKTSTLIWRPPVMARYDFSHKSHMTVYATPVRPGHMRLFFAVYKKAADTPPVMRALFRLLALPALRFYGHWGNSAVLAGDNPFIAVQGARLRAAEADGRSYKDLMFFPTSLDAAVARIRAWFAACPVVWAPGAAARGAVPTKYEAIERKRSHTDLCAHCTAAMRRFVALRAVAVAVAAVAAVYVVGGLGAGRPLARGVAALAAGAAGMAALAHAAVARFVYVDYVHADKN